MHKLTYEELLKQRKTVDEAREQVSFPIHVVVDNVRSLYNVGSLFRTADATNIHSLWLCGFTPFPPRKEISKTALGADETVAWQYRSTTIEAIEELRAAGVTIVAIELTSEAIGIDGLQAPDFPLALVVGNEVNGISDDVLALCDKAVVLPMYGVKHSLNVAVASGIAMYGAVERWLQTSHTNANATK